jgi:hypothetical protein
MELMSKKFVPYKRNSAGFWIDAKTGRFAKKSDYLPYLEKETAQKAARATKQKAANEARSKATSEYWKDVKQFQNMGYDVKTARKYVHNSPKYLAKRGKTGKQFSDFWKELKKAGLNNNKQAVKDKKKKLEDEGYELISY